MLGFYKIAAVTFLSLMASSGLLLYLGVELTPLNVPIVSEQKRAIAWTARLVPDPFQEGGSSLVVNEDTQLLDWDFVLATDVPYPYASYSLDFADIAQPQNLLDWTQYHGVSFKVRCSPQNVLVIVLFTQDEKVTVPTQHSTYRVSSTFFPCGETWSTINMPFVDLGTPDWWLHKFGVSLTDRNSRLEQVFGLGFVNSLQSPRNTFSNVKIADLRLTGDDPRYLYGAGIAVLLLWVLSGVWLFRRYIAALVAQVQENVKRDRPLVAYQKLTIDSRADKDETAVISYMAAEYANPHLDLEMAVNSLGVNRNKINETLKSEIGLTFSGYLNKLRLTEAARLLLEQQNVNVAQIAYAVGYNNVTYFNKLFKNEYGCTPKSFKMLCQTSQSNED